jgi:SAM-dependent methyltransferase
MDAAVLAGDESVGDYYSFDDINYSAIRLFRAACSAFPPNPTVLSLGCGRARLELELEHFGAIVTGIDSSPVACATARTRIHRVIESDLALPEGLDGILEPNSFDWIIAADVLEHFADGASLLKQYLKFLRPTGRIIISLPNMALWSNRLHLLSGRFEYRPTGVRDRTHLRFYTIKTALELLRSVGLNPIKRAYEPGIIRTFLPLIRRFAISGGDPGAILDSRAYQVYRRCLLPVENRICNLLPGLLALRIVVMPSKEDRRLSVA